jgi:hypothetical protein
MNAVATPGKGGLVMSMNRRQGRITEYAIVRKTVSQDVCRLKSGRGACRLVSTATFVRLAAVPAKEKNEWQA